MSVYPNMYGTRLEEADLLIELGFEYTEQHFLTFSQCLNFGAQLFTPRKSKCPKQSWDLIIFERWTVLGF